MSEGRSFSSLDIMDVEGLFALPRYETEQQREWGTSQRNYSGDVENMRVLIVLQRTRGASSSRVVWRSQNETSTSVQRTKMWVR